MIKEKTIACVIKKPPPALVIEQDEIEEFCERLAAALIEEFELDEGGSLW